MKLGMSLEVLMSGKAALADMTLIRLVRRDPSVDVGNRHYKKQ